jgi:hypothetical protein
MKNYFDFIYIDSPKPSEKWSNLPLENRFTIIKNLIENSEFSDSVKLTEYKNNDQIYVEFTKIIEVQFRSKILLDLELLLKNKIDQCLIIWHSPQGDRSSLRRLRGVNVL